MFKIQGAYSIYKSLNNKIDDLHCYITFVIKFGIEVAAYDISQEIRNSNLSVDEEKNLLKI